MSRETDSVLSVEIFNYDFVPDKIFIVINSVLKSDYSIFSLDFLQELECHSDFWSKLVGFNLLGNKFYVHTFNSGFKIPTTKLPYDGVVYVPVMSSSHSPDFAQTHFYFKQFESSDINHRTLSRWEKHGVVDVAYWNGVEVSSINPYSYAQIVKGRDMPYLYEGYHVPKEYFKEGDIFKTTKDVFLITNIRCDKYRYDSEIIKTTLPKKYGQVCFTQFENLFPELDQPSVFLYSFLRNLSQGRKILIYPSSIGISSSFVFAFLKDWRRQLELVDCGSNDVTWNKLLLMRQSKKGVYDKIKISELIKNVMLYGYDYKTAVLILDYLNRFKTTTIDVRMEAGKFDAFITFDVFECCDQNFRDYEWDGMNEKVD